MELLSTGAFAREAGLTRKALRVYDQQGVLVPMAVDADTGYRWYAREQLAAARLVARLRRIGMPLDRLREVCGLAPSEAALAVVAFRREIEAIAADRAHDAGLLVTELAEGAVMTISMTTMHCAARSHIGAVRTTNEDLAHGDGRIAAVADGLGGHVRGEQASAAAIGVLVEAAAEDLRIDELEALMERADAAVTALARGDQRPMTTVTALRLVGRRLAVLHVGDGRGYLLRGGQLSRLTQDHSRVQQLVDAGRVDAGELRTHPERALLVRALGAGAGRAEADVALRTPIEGDRYLLCTDGLWSPVPPAEIADALPGGTPEEAAERLVALALDHGGPDNVAVVVADIG